MSKKIYILILLLPILIIACSRSSDYLTINNTKVNLIDVLSSDEETYLGLSFRESICENCGMLFEFNEKSQKTFVMRDMMFSLDIIWIDDDVVIKIDEKLPPEGHEVSNYYSSERAITRVLEVNGGFTSENDIKVGDKIIFNILKDESR
ncbi:hypothetical protein C0584_00345 [Candidatus Parcubacteria bacterium]|nr:MAG: hypothetical protein C0584_00345 [Candidatus Parcubacteria bacterium]